MVTFTQRVLILTSPSGLCVQFLGLHLHSDNTGSHKNSHAPYREETPDYIYKMLVLLAGIYYFYLMETIFSLVAYEDNHHHHQHHHGVREEIIHRIRRIRIENIIQIKKLGLLKRCFGNYGILSFICGAKSCEEK